MIHDFRYVSKEEYGPERDKIEQLIRDVREELREYFTFQHRFVGSTSRRMITRDFKSNVGYDFDVNLFVNDEEEEYSAGEIRDLFRNAINKHAYKYGYKNAEDSTRVLTIKVVNRSWSTIEHSCDFAIVFDCEDGRQQYIRFNKNQGSYTWEYQPKGFYGLSDKIDELKKAGLWQIVRDKYIENKNNNSDPNKKSRSIFAETVNQVYQFYL